MYGNIPVQTVVSTWLLEMLVRCCSEDPEAPTFRGFHPVTICRTGIILNWKMIPSVLQLGQVPLYGVEEDTLNRYSARGVQKDSAASCRMAILQLRKA